MVWDTSASGMPSAGIFHGHRGVERFFRDWLGTWRSYGIAMREYLDAGDSVVVVFRQRGTGRESGIESERDFFGVYDLRRSKVVRFRFYDSPVEALKAVGVGGVGGVAGRDRLARAQLPTNREAACQLCSCSTR